MVERENESILKKFGCSFDFEHTARTVRAMREKQYSQLSPSFSITINFG